MRVLGLDPGTERFGYAIIEYGLDYNSKGRILCAGVLKKPYQKIFTGMSKIIGKYHPELAAIEKLYFSKNTKTAMKVAEARGIAALSLEIRGVKSVEVHPTEVKMHIAGYGRADKNTIRKSLAMHLAKQDLLKTQGVDDIADATAIAITGFYKNKVCPGSYRY